MFISTMLRRARLCLVGVLAAWPIAGAFTISASHAAESSEAQVKAAYIFNFAKFIAWPDTEGEADFTICVQSGDELQSSLAALSGKLIAGAPVVIRAVSNALETGSCRILHLSDGWGGAFPVRQTVRRGLLTVGDSMDFAENGGVIGLFHSDRKIRFAINVDAALAADLKINSKLLNLAHILRSP